MMHTFMRTCIHTYVCMYIQTCMYIHIYIYYIHTQIHIHCTCACMHAFINIIEHHSSETVITILY